jgi:erythromycin esterase
MDNAEPTPENAQALTRRRFVGVAAAAAAGAAATGTGLVGGQPATAAPAAQAARSETVVSWLNRNAAPLRTLEAQGPLYDLNGLRRIAANARIVGIGYGAHGTHTETTVHLRVIRFLVEHMGFRTLAWEEGWGHGVAIDRFVVDGVGTAHDLVDQAFPIIRHEGFLEVLQWLRDFNSRRPRHDRVRFLGTDAVDLRQILFDRLTQYATEVAPDRLSELNTHLDPLRMHGGPQDTIMWYVDPEKTEEWRDSIVAIARAMFDFVKALPDRPSSVARVDAIQDAQTILGFYDFLSWKGTIGDTREYYISETINRWMGHVPGKLIYIAHNGHIAANQEMVVSIPPFDMDRTRSLVGWCLRRDYGHSYVPIGTCFDHGQVFVGWQSPDGPRVYDLPAADPSFLDHTLGQARAANYLLDLTTCGPESPEVKQFLDGPAKVRFIASPYDATKDGIYKQVNTPLRREGFDAILYVREVQAARMFPM